MTSPHGTSDMSLDHLPEVTSARLGPVDRLRALPRAAWYVLLRLFRRDERYYLTIDGQVVARFVSMEDHLRFMTWLHQTHTATFDFGFNTGKEFLVAQHIADGPDASVPGPE